MKEIALTKGLVSLVDDADFDWLNQWKWYASGGKYAARRDAEQGKRLVYMHRLIVDPSPDLDVDHINRNTLDNRRTNLRAATVSQNMAHGRHRARTRSLYRGVEPISGGRRWRARIAGFGETDHIGCFPDQESAARAFDREAIRLHGEFATLNFPEEHGLGPS